jgi:hypothetical protein
MRIPYSSPNVGIVIISKPPPPLFTNVGCGLLEKGINCRWFNRKVEYKISTYGVKIDNFFVSYKT